MSSDITNPRVQLEPRRMRAIPRLAARMAGRFFGAVPGWYMLLIEPFASRETTIVQTVSAGARYELDLSEFVQRKFYFRSYERRELRFIRSTLSDGDTFVDVGANVGLLSLCAAECVGPTGEVLALEPDPQNVTQLQRNLELNPKSGVRVLPAAIGATRGKVRLGMPASQAGIQNSGARSRSSSENQIEVEQITIDDAVAQALPRCVAVHLVKIDVEGMELDVLQGGPELFGRSAARVMLEVNQRYGEGASAVEMLRSLDYQIFRLGVFARLRPWPASNPPKAHSLSFLHGLPSGIGQWISGDTRLTTAVAIHLREFDGAPCGSHVESA